MKKKQKTKMHVEKEIQKKKQKWKYEIVLENMSNTDIITVLRDEITTFFQWDCQCSK